MTHRNTHRSTAPLVGILLLFAAAGSLAAAPIFDTPDAIPGRYLVVLHDDAAAGAPWARDGESPVRGIAREIEQKAHGRVDHVYGRALTGFALETDARAARELLRDSRVQAVYPDARVTPTMVQSPVPSWGLDRLDQRSPELDSSFELWSWGDRVHIYVVDSGIRSTHLDFDGRVDTRNSFTAVDDGLGAEDCLGHGTAVAGIAAGYETGVAKGATLHSARVFDCAGQASLSQVLAAIDWVTNESRSPAVGLLALQTGAHPLFDDAIRQSTAAGVLWVVAAGNSGDDACSYSPARVPEALTVGAVRNGDERASFSNTGSCVDLWAPGVDITTTGAGADDQFVGFGGTSAAAPHVAGIAAMWFENNSRETPGAAAWMLTGAATPFVDSSGVPGLLAYSDLGAGTVDLRPYARFTSDCSGSACVFDGSPSFDDHGIADWHWSIGPGIEEVSGSKRSKVRLRTSTIPAEWTRILVTLTLTDTAGQTSTLTKAVTVPSGR